MAAQVRYCSRCCGRLAADQPGTRCSPCLRAEREPGRATAKPAVFWQRDTLRLAAATRHFGKIVHAYRHAHDPALTQSQVALWLGVTQAQVSRLERAARGPQDLDKLQRWAELLHVPAQLLWFTVTYSSHASDSRPTAVNLAMKPRSEGDDVRRRDLLKITSGTLVGAGANLLADTPWQRLTDSIAGRRAADSTTVEMMEDRTFDHFHAEEVEPARQLLASLLAHRDALRTLVESTASDVLRRRLITAAGETEALTGWVLFDLQRPTAAERSWRNALAMAKEVSDGPLTACVLGYWSYLVSAQGDAHQAVRMLDSATRHVRGSAPTTQAWLAARQAEECSTVGDADGALQALDRAVTVFDYARPRVERAWTSFFTASRLGSLTVSTYGRLGHRETDSAASSLLRSLAPIENKVRALVLADLATTAVRRGDLDRTADLVSESAPLAVRTEASLAVDRLWGVVDELPPPVPGRPSPLHEWLTATLAGAN